MTPEKRLDRLERILTLAIVAGRRRMRKLDEKIAILIDSQIRTDDELSKIKELFRETDLKFKETDRQFKETDLKFKETDRKFEETPQRFRETDELFRRHDERIERLLKSRS